MDVSAGLMVIAPLVQPVLGLLYAVHTTGAANVGLADGAEVAPHCLKFAIRKLEPKEVQTVVGLFGPM